MITVADLCPYWSWPPTGGGPLRVYNLNKRVAAQVQVLQFSVRPTFGHQQHGWSSWVGTRSHQLAQNYWEYQYFHPAILGTGYLLYKSGLHSDLFLSSMLRLLSPVALHEIIKSASIIQVEHPWLFDLARHLAHGRPIVYVAHNVEAALWGQLDEGAGGALGVFKQRTRELERAAVRDAHAVVAMSPQDAATLVQDYGASLQRLTIIPNGIDLQSRSPATAEKKAAARKRLGIDAKPVLLFTGSDHYPNKEALAHIQRWQAYLGSELGIQFIVVGTAGRGIQSTEHMRVVGFVDDISDYLAAADIALNPLTSGSGTSLKIGEYLACGLPTVTTLTGIRGLQLTPGEDVLLGEISEFPQLIKRLLKERELRENLGRHGHQTAAAAYSWDYLADHMLGVYAKVAQCASA